MALEEQDTQIYDLPIGDLDCSFANAKVYDPFHSGFIQQGEVNEEGQEHIADFKEHRGGIFGCVVKLKIEFGDGVYQGTGELVKKGYEDRTWSKYFIRTCANNFLHINNEEYQQPISAKAFIHWYGEGEYHQALDIDQFACYTNYHGDSKSGYDYALASVKAEELVIPSFYGKIVLNDPSYLPLISSGDSIKLYGYPSHREGFFESSGYLQEIQELNENHAIAVYDAVASFGQNGSPVVISSPFSNTLTPKINAAVPSYDRKSLYGVQIAVHSGYDFQEQKNYGTVVTEEIYRWEGEIIQQFWNGDYLLKPTSELAATDRDRPPLLLGSHVRSSARIRRIPLNTNGTILSLEHDAVEGKPILVKFALFGGRFRKVPVSSNQIVKAG